jgi:hypothetical protein
LVSRNPELFEIGQIVEIFKDFDFIITNPESFEVGKSVETLNGFDGIVGEVKSFETGAFLKAFDFLYLVLVEPETFEFGGIDKSFNVSNTTIDKSERLDTFESIDDRHVTKIFENKFNGLDFIDLFPLGIFEAVHFFLGIGKGFTIRSRSWVSLFL